MRGNLLCYALAALLALSVVSAQPQLSFLSVEPEPLVEGGFISISYELRSDDDLGLVSTHVSLGDEVNWRVTQSVHDDRHRFVDAFRIPDDYAGTHDLRIRVQFTDEFPIIIEDEVRVVDGRSTATTEIPRSIIDQRSGERVNIGAPVFASGEQGLAIIIDPEVPNVERGEWIYWPITLQNTEDRPITATLGVKDVRGWATYRIDPQPEITVQPGEQEMAYLYMSIDEDAWLGLRYFEITAAHDGVVESETASLAVIREYHPPAFQWVAWAIIILAVLLVIGGIILLMTRNDYEGGEDDDLITYY